MKKISVIIPCYKYAHYLGECVESLCRQTFKDFEIIIVDDGSPDNTIQVANDLITKYPSIKISVVSQKNKGLSAARNYGISFAEGKYIMCLDADDKLVPNGLKEHLDLIEDDKTIAQCALMEFGDSHEIHTPQGANLLSLLQRNTVYCNAMFPKKAWEETGGYDENETVRLGYEDWIFWIACAEKGYKFKTSNNLALRYRIHSISMTRMTAHPNVQKLYSYIYNKYKALYDEYDVKVAGLLF